MNPTLDDVRRLALSLPEAVEQDHHGFPSFRLRGKIFSTVRLNQPLLMVKLPGEDQENMVAAYPAAIEPVPGGWGRKGATFVKYEMVEERTIAALLRLAWFNVAPKGLRETVFPAG